MDFTIEDIEAITTSVWASMLDQELVLDRKTKIESLEASHVGMIRLTGAFCGRIEVHLSESLVRGAASVMFDVPAESVNDDEMTDTVQELTNMVGGNVKSLVEQPSRLGLPEVFRSDQVNSHDDGMDRTTALGFQTSDGGMVVAIYCAKAA